MSSGDTDRPDVEAGLEGPFSRAQDRVNERTALVEALGRRFREIRDLDGDEKTWREDKSLIQIASEVRSGLDGIKDEVQASGPGAVTKDHATRLQETLDSLSDEEKKQFGLQDAKVPRFDPEQGGRLN